MNKLGGDKIAKSFNADLPPALVVELGEQFLVETTDRFRDYMGPDSPSEVLDIVSSMNGPVYVKGAEPGMTLKIELLDMRPAREIGYLLAFPGMGLLGDYISSFRLMPVTLTSTEVWIGGEKIGTGRKGAAPLRPMLGRLGVAPPEGDALLEEMGVFGGQMSNPDITTGSVVYLPVFHQGAFLYLGDSHACMADGEATSSAVEASLEVALRVSVEEKLKLNGPLVVTLSHAVITGQGRTMEEAAGMAIKAMAELLMKRLNIDQTQAAMLIGGTGDVRCSLLLRPPYKMRVSMPRTVLGL